MPARKIVVPDMPDWLKYVADDGSINAKDFAGLLGLGRTTFDNRVNDGEIPQPDYRIGHIRGRVKVRQWTGDTVRKFFAEHYQ